MSDLVADIIRIWVLAFAGGMGLGLATKFLRKHVAGDQDTPERG